MDGAWVPYAADAIRAVQVLHHPTATPLELVQETASDGVDLSPYCSQVTQSASEASISLSWHNELYGSAQPKPGQILELQLDGAPLWWGVIESLNDYRLEVGTRTMSLLARSRDASPFWRNVRRVTDIYPTATPLALIARNVAASLGLADNEMNLPSSSGYTVHSNTQLADLPAWEMLEQLYAPFGSMPFVDARGRLKTISRDVGRAADIVLTEDRIQAVTGARSRSPVSLVRIKWLDPALTRVEQQDQSLAQATITAGYFQLEQRKDISFSNDGSQRAENTYLVIKQSANSGLVEVCDETYEQLSQTSGRIVLTTARWVPGLIGVFLALKAAAALPDISLPFGGPTAPIGKIVYGGIELSVLLVMASIGTGMYEVNGTPYDFVHARNSTEAYDSAAPSWMGNEVEIENDFVGSEQAAQAYAVRELIYQARAASSFGLTLIDDPRIEPGDIVQLPDGTRVYITGYSRDLTSGAPALLNVEGFQI
jgi:hypothetical protein